MRKVFIVSEIKNQPDHKTRKQANKNKVVFIYAINLLVIVQLFA
jgi:hypothetical protein